VRKANKKELQESNRLLKQKLSAEKKVAQEKRKEEQARMRAVKEQQQAERKAERERQRQACNSAKAIQQPQKAKRKASKPLTRQKKRARCTVAAMDGPPAEESVVASLPKLNSRGRPIKPPKKFE
jgi:hypothetical protein